MPDLPQKGPPEEQKICIKCGYCCDGTLFSHARLNQGERGRLPEKIEESSYCEGGKDFFRLPCRYFSGRCTIYNLKRANVCSSYRCQLLKDFSEGNISTREALAIVSKAGRMRQELIEQYRKISGNAGLITFKQILMELGNNKMSDLKDDKITSDNDILQARCNIFEALLIKYFRSDTDFGKMMDGLKYR